MDCKKYLHFLCLVVVVHDSMSLVLSNGKCLYSMNETSPDDAPFNKTTQICCTKSGVHDKYYQGHEVECCGDTTYIPEIDLCCKGKVYNRPGTERIGNGNYSRDTNSDDKSASKASLNKQGNPTYRDAAYKNKIKQTILNIKFQRLMKQKGRNLLRDLLIYIDIAKAKKYSKKIPNLP
ncbi:uncharacterized protein LOC134260655 [Saccostrea cucullata]|uniref:uncharacterized protein LOC134260655 n=1 Tax=Saccostrea cuccullata TaxID=36930 RepID=UPI002ED4AA57